MSDSHRPFWCESREGRRRRTGPRSPCSSMASCATSATHRLPFFLIPVVAERGCSYGRASRRDSAGRPRPPWRTGGWAAMDPRPFFVHIAVSPSPCLLQQTATNRWGLPPLCLPPHALPIPIIAVLWSAVSHLLWCSTAASRWSLRLQGTRF